MCVCIYKIKSDKISDFIFFSVEKDVHAFKSVQDTILMQVPVQA